MDQTFPVAQKQTIYLINRKTYQLVKESEGKSRPDGVRAMLGDKLKWFLPAEQEELYESTDKKPSPKS